jgi:hypothetical protein
MTYTTQQLQAMSDFEVNKALCIKLGHDVSGISEQRNMMTDAVTDYCNNPNDIMPLLESRKLNIGPKVHFHNGEFDCWLAADTHWNVGYSDANYCRAIACLILMMED